MKESQLETRREWTSRRFGRIGTRVATRCDKMGMGSKGLGMGLGGMGIGMDGVKG